VFGCFGTPDVRLASGKTRMSSVEPTAIAAAVVLATKLLDGLGAEMGRSTWAGMQRLVELLRGHLAAHGQAEAALERVIRHQHDETGMSDLARVLRELADKDDAFRAKLTDAVAAVQVERIISLPPRNRAFTGREDLIRTLRAGLETESHVAVVQARALHGLGGVGKTQLAVEYAYRFLDDYDLVWWVPAEQAVAIPTALVALARRLGIPEAGEQDEMIDRLRNQLRERPRWLLIYDNAERPRDLEPYLPGTRGHVLITSRNPAWAGIAAPLKVDVMLRAEAVAFLLKRSRGQDDTTAAALAAELGDLPLALEQAAAYVEQRGTTMAAYLEMFRGRRDALLAQGEPTAYNGTIDTTWRLSMERVKESASAGVGLLRLCALLAPEAIPMDLLREWSEEFPIELADIVHDEVAFEDALGALYRYSLIDRDAGEIRVHQLVQAVARKAMTGTDEEHWATVALRLVLRSFPVNSFIESFDNWAACARLLPHALAAARNAEALGIEAEATILLLNHVAAYLWGRGETAQARSVLESALRLGETRLGLGHLEVARTLDNLGQTLRVLDDLAGARAAHERALAILENRLGAGDLAVAQCLINLGVTLHLLHPLSAARAALERALAIHEARLKPDDLRVARSLDHLGQTLETMGELVGARAALERALAIRQTRLDSQHLDVAASLDHLGQTLHAIGELAPARAALDKALAIRQLRLGLDHREVARTLDHLGVTLHAMGYVATAREAHERALDIFERRLGPKNRKVAKSLDNLGVVRRALGDLVGARIAHERAAAIFKAHLGPDHRYLARSLDNLGTALRELGDLHNARLAHEQAVAIFEAKLGADHVLTRAARRNLAIVFRERAGRPETASPDSESR
jgi:tetratricopeptide (TPR) repeat protein